LTGETRVIRRRTSIRLAAALAACCVLSLAFVATALAKHSHSELTGAQSPAGETGAPETSATATSEAGAGETGAGTTAASAPASAQTGSTDAQAGSAGATSGSADAQRTAGAQAHKKETTTKSKRSHETALKGAGASKSGKGESESEAAGTSTPTASESTAPTTAVVATAAASTPAAASSTAAPASFSPSAAASTGTSFKSTAAAHPGRARGARHATSARRQAPVASSSALDSLAPPAAFVTRAPLNSKPPAAGGHALPPASFAERRGRPSPLATTITRIVDVVPLAVRELIAALLALALLLGMRTRLAALRARRLERQRAQLLEDVGLLQAALLPDAPARLGPVGTSVAYRPADGPGAGGDFYDVFALADGQLAVIVGDVSGHGRQALPHTALVRFTLRAYLEAGLSPRDAVQTAGAVLERQLGGAFATVIAATYQPRERVLVYASAGHPPPIVLGVAPAAGAGGGITAGDEPTDSAAARALVPVTACSSPPIGVGMRTGTRQTVVSVPGQALICFHTDGLTEARVGSELFGAERLRDTLAELAADATAPELLARVAERSDARPDDMAACVLSVEGREAAPAVLVEELELDRDDAAGARAERFLLACGLEHDELAAAAATARAAAVRAGTAVLTVRHAAGAPPEVAVERERLAHLSARRANAAVAL
jgi:hypothetical protein